MSREELETERGWEESKEVLFPSLETVGIFTTTTTIILINLKDDRWSEAETIEALREAGLVTFLDLQTGIVSGVNFLPCNLACIGEAEGWKEEEFAAILRLEIHVLIQE